MLPMHDAPLFLGLTRPPKIFGLPIGYFVSLMLGSVIPFLGASCMENIRGLGQAGWAMQPGLSPIPPQGAAKPSMMVAAEKTRTTPKKMARKRGQFRRPVNIM
ncbi:MAG: VirB3 family type IV secretion system protein [Phenylobacterium sp.]